jgi:hypothetical protein
MPRIPTGSTPTGLRRFSFSPEWAIYCRHSYVNSSGLISISFAPGFCEQARASKLGQPWALWRNPVGVGKQTECGWNIIWTGKRSPIHPKHPPLNLKNHSKYKRDSVSPARDKSTPGYRAHDIRRRTVIPISPKVPDRCGSSPRRLCGYAQTKPCSGPSAFRWDSRARCSTTSVCVNYLVTSPVFESYV